jgi:hypothetical protein
VSVPIQPLLATKDISREKRSYQNFAKLMKICEMAIKKILGVSHR